MKTPAIPEHSMLGTFVVPVALALRQRGFDPVEEVSAVGMDLAKAANPDWRVSQPEFGRLLQHCVSITGEEAFALDAAEQLQPQILHSLGLAWLASDTVYDGLRRLVRFSRLISTGMDLKLNEDNDMVQLTLAHDPEFEELSTADRDYAVGIVTRMCRLTLGEYLAPIKVSLDRPQPEHPEKWEYMLACHVEFGSSNTCITWSRADISEPLVTGDPALARINDEYTQTYLNAFAARSTTREVVNKIVERLPDGPPNQQQIADALHVSNRTLQRKLKDEGTSFMDLLQNTRMQLACKYLRQPSRSVVETAYMLGFSEPSTFSRAFKRWTGLAPAAYRSGEQEKEQA
jgi:AraC-like DNA-binding protein